MIVSVLLIAGHIFAEARGISEFSIRYHELLSKEISADVVYTAVVSVLSSLFFAKIFEDNKKKHIVSIIAYGVSVFAVFIASFCLAAYARKLSIIIPDGRMLAVIAGGCAFGMWLRHAKFKLPVLLITAAVVFITYIFGFGMQAGLFVSAETESYDYLRDINPRAFDNYYDGRARYDESAGFVVMDGTPHERSQPRKKYGGRCVSERLPLKRFRLILP
ncbi:MAG: hypothetical protein MJ125_06490 [Clostridia bacterium]|nr:hypothetical protein [Clostridia bacterium]